MNRLQFFIDHIGKTIYPTLSLEQRFYDKGFKVLDKSHAKILHDFEKQCIDSGLKMKHYGSIEERNKETALPDYQTNETA